ncbi:hypothetical protein HDU76_000125 [Blyttiomyces sp. JEL0837]|nr:hypothetical protein HDU76_000125 [Blyttiomyces sp. JEL0837]
MSGSEIDGGPSVNWSNFNKLTVQTLSGEKIPLRSLSEKGRTCFVFLRRFDCATCYTYLVLFAHLRPALQSSNIRIVFISCHEDLSEVQLFLKSFAFWLRELSSYGAGGGAVSDGESRVTSGFQSMGALPGEIYLDGSRDSYRVFGLFEEIDKPQEARLYVHEAFKNQFKGPKMGVILQSPGIVVVESNTLLYRFIVRDQNNAVPDGRDPRFQEALACDAYPETLENLDEKVIRGVERFLDTVYDAAHTARVNNNELQPIKRLGQGRESEVFKSTYQGVEVAVKYFRYKPPPVRVRSYADEGSSSDQSITEAEEENEESLISFANESALLMSLRHRNIITMMGFGSRPPHHFLITEFMPRGSVFDVLGDFKQYPTLSSELKHRMLMDVASGMAFLHSCNPLIIHQDLKSLNLLVAEDWTVKVSDFGIAKEVSPPPPPPPKTNSLFKFTSSNSKENGNNGSPKPEEEEDSRPAHGGTLQWMSPELLLGDVTPTTKMDVFAFGVICWEIATRRRPWKSIPAKVITNAVVAGKRCPITEEDQWNREFYALVSGCWAQNAADRPEFGKVVKMLAKVVVP